MTKEATKVQDDAKQPRPAAEDVTLDRIHPWPKNPDPPTPKHVREIMRSVKRFGWGEPILARVANGEIIAGHARYLAARRLKLATVPVRFMDLSEGEAHMLALADNKIPANRERDWTSDDIAGIMEELEANGTDVEMGTGFDEEEIDALIGDPDDPLTSEGGEGGEGGGGGDDDAVYEVIVTCTDEAQQTELLERFAAEGLAVRALLG